MSNRNQGVDPRPFPKTGDAPVRPNILMLISEQHNPRVLGCAGHPVVRTPNIDRLTAEGVYFPNAYSATPLCVPGRVAMITGRHSRSLGVVENIYEDKLQDNPTIPRALRAAGYRTCHIGKTHLATGDTDRKRMDEIGFDSDLATTGKMGAGIGVGDGPYVNYIKGKGLSEKLRADYHARIDERDDWLGCARPSVLDVADYHDQWVNDSACHYLENVDDDTPFYLAVNWLGPHGVRDAPGRYATMYDPAEIDPPIDDPMHRAPNKVRQRRDDTLAKLRDGDWRALRASYYGMVSLIDDGVGMMLDVLDRRGMLDNTLIVFVADHGEMLCDHGCVYKTMMYEQAAGVPLIFRWPKRFRRGTQATSAASHVDLAPTLLASAGIAPIAGSHGRSLMPVLTDGHEHDEPIFCEFKTTRMIRHGRYKYICDETWDVNQLFDLAADPAEVNNLVEDNPAIAKKLHEQITTWAKTV